MNYLIDPLWYVHGNQITGQNFLFNERVAKINLLNRTVGDSGYDCLILGSSRVTALRPSQLVGQRCFNLSLKGAEVAEFVVYARYARDAGLMPKTVYVSVDDFNFVEKKETERRTHPHAEGSASILHAFFSADVMMFSLMTLAGISPDPHMYLDSAYEAVEWGGLRYAKPELTDKVDIHCNLGRVDTYHVLREVFPDSMLVGYAPPMTPWHKLSDVYSRGVLDCVAAAYHGVAARYDRFFDFTFPTTLTESRMVSYDGSHFSPAANDLVAAQLSGQRSDLAIDVKSLSLDAYQSSVRASLKAFLDRHGRRDFWRD